MGPAVGGAIVIGVSGFLLHRMWIGLALGPVLSMWALLILWAVTAQGQTWERPPVDESTTIATYAPELWQALPIDFTRLAGYVSAAAMITGLAATLLWPRVGTVVLFSAIGVSMLTIMGLVAMEMGRPQWLDHLPAETVSQVVTLAALVAFGAVVQWRTAPAKIAPPKKD